MMRSLHEDLYTVVGQIDPQSKRATFQFHVNPLVSWIWLGLLILIAGTVTSLFPELSLGEVGAWSYVRAGAGVAAGTAFAVWIAMAPGMAYTHERPEASARRPAGLAVRSLKSATNRRTRHGGLRRVWRWARWSRSDGADELMLKARATDG